MLIKLSPQKRDNTLQVSVSGESVTINGEDLDLSAIPNGATVPADAVNSIWVAGPIEKDENGEVTLTLLLPHGADAPEETRFPAPILVTEDGPIDLPPYNAPEAEE